MAQTGGGAATQAPAADTAPIAGTVAGPEVIQLTAGGAVQAEAEEKSNPVLGWMLGIAAAVGAVAIYDKNNKKRLLGAGKRDKEDEEAEK